MYFEELETLSRRPSDETEMEIIQYGHHNRKVTKKYRYRGEVNAKLEMEKTMVKWFVYMYLGHATRTEIRLTGAQQMAE